MPGNSYGLQARKAIPIALPVKIQRAAGNSTKWNNMIQIKQLTESSSVAPVVGRRFCCVTALGFENGR